MLLKKFLVRAVPVVFLGLSVGGAFAQPGFDGPPPGFGPDGGFGPGPGGPGMQQEKKVVSRFDKDGDRRLNPAERKAAREWLKTENSGDGRRFGRRGPGGPGGNEEPAKPGRRLTPSEVKNYANAPLYDPMTLRTFFLEFEESDWEKELQEFHNTDVEVPAKLTVDGKTYTDVGVHFRGMSSYMMVSEGHKRSLNLSLDFAHQDQNIGGYRTLNLMNSHEDPTFLRGVLSYQIDREYIPAPKANFARVVINGESWGLYVNVQQFNKDFTKEFFGSTKGARWKVRGSPNGRGSLAYLGDDPAEYKSIYTIKTKDDPKRWDDFIKLCKVLNQTPPEKLQEALAPILDIDGALKFIALDNALINNDGYWIRTSDYSIYEDEKGRFHIIPQDSNETFSKPGGPGFGGGGPGGRGGFGPGMMLANQMLSQGDRNEDRKLSRQEFAGLAENWFDKLDSEKSDKLNEAQFSERFGDLLPPPPGFGGPGGGRGFGPGRFIGPNFFRTADLDKNGSVTRAEFKQTFENWFARFDNGKTGLLDEEKLRAGLSEIFPGRGPGGPGGPGGRGGGQQIKGVELDPLYAVNETSKPLISKLLAVPELRARYLAYVRDITEKWLDWEKLGPITQQYVSLIQDDVKADTRKLDSTEDFFKGITSDIEGKGFGPGGGGTIGLKSFADQRRKYLLDHPAVKKAGKL